MSGLDKSLRDRIEVVDHKVIFQGHENCLPTFNSVSIEAALHRIPNLAERFIYFNDDFLLLADCKPEDFFVQDGLVLRGEFVHKFVKQGLYTQHRLNAAHLVGAEPGRIFRSAHVCHPVLKSLVEEFYASNPGLFERNIRFRFRDKSQFLMSTLVEHLAILKGMATIQTQVDYHVITAENCPSGNVKLARRQVARLLMNGNKLGCINNFKNVMGTSPNLLPKLERRLTRRRSNDRLSFETTTWRRVKVFLKRVLRWGK